MDLADLYVSVLPDMSQFGSRLNERLRNIGKTSGDKVGKDLGTGIEATAAKTTKGQFLQNPTMMASARAAGAKIGGFLATSLGKQIGGRVTERLGTVLADKLYDRASARLKRLPWQKALANPALGAAAVGAGIWLAKKLADRANKQVAASFKPNLQSGMSKGLGGLKFGIAGALAGVLGGGAVSGIKSLADQAGSFNEQISKSRNIFGESSKAIESWASTAARSMGLSNSEALAGAASFGNLFDQLDFGAKQSVEMSKGFVQMASDAASFNDANPAEVMDAFLSATRGEYDALQRYIPTASAARIEAEAYAMTGKKTAKELTAADKAAALYQVSVEDLGKAHGDFARTASGYANTQRIFNAVWADTRIQIGQYFLPMFTRAMVYMNEEGFPAIKRIVDVVGPLAQSFSAVGKAALTSLGGDFATAIDGASTNLTEIADWLETHEAAMLTFFVKMANGAFELARGIAGLVSGGIRGFASLSGGMADFIDGALPGLQALINGVADFVDSIPGQNEAAQKIRDSAVALGESGAAASRGLRGARDSGNEAADAFDKKVYPALDKAQKRLNDVGRTKIWEAAQRDAARAAKQAVDKIGTAADGSQVKLKRWNDRTKLGAEAQRGLEARIKTARQKMIDQYVQGQKNAVGQERLTKRWNQGKDALYKEFKQMGLTSKEAKTLAERYGKIPGKVSTKQERPGMTAALREAKLLRERYRNIPKSVSTKVDWDTAVDKINTKLVFKGGKGARLMSAGGPDDRTPGVGGPDDRTPGVGGPPLAEPTWGGPATARTFGAVHSEGTRTVQMHGTEAVADLLKQLAPQMAVSSAPGSPGGKVAGKSVGAGWGPIQAAMRAHGARTFNTYPGHHPTMERARDIYPHNWAAANAARALSSVWYVIYRMRIASKNHGNTWRPFTPSSTRGDYRHERHIHVARYDRGGVLPPGASVAINNTGKGERIPDPTADRPPVHVHLYVDGRELVNEVLDDDGEFRASLARMGGR